MGFVVLDAEPGLAVMSGSAAARTGRIQAHDKPGQRCCRPTISWSAEVRPRSLLSTPKGTKSQNQESANLQYLGGSAQSTIILIGLFDLDYANSSATSVDGKLLTTDVLVPVCQLNTPKTCYIRSSGLRRCSIVFNIKYLHSHRRRRWKLSIQ
jgi:hypothetical protein